MEHRIHRAARVTCVLVAALALAACKKDERTQRLRVLATTDEHSHVFAFAPEIDDHPLGGAPGSGALRGGIARRATVLDAARAGGIDTVTLSNGDFSQGTLVSAGFAVANFDLRLMKLLGYDAIGLGNHEFDLGGQGLAASIQAATAHGGLPPLVLANVSFDPASAADDALAAMTGGVGSGKPITPGTVITTTHGIRVGVVGAMGPSAAFDAGPLAAPVTFTGTADPRDQAAATAAIAAAVQPVVDGLRRTEGVDVVILLAHAGASRPGAPADDANLLVGALRGVDLVVAGHTHTQPDEIIYVADAEGRSVPIVEPGPYGTEVARVDLVFTKGERPTVARGGPLPDFLSVDDPVLPTADATLRAALDGVMAALETRTGTGPSFLEATLTAVEGAPVVDDPAIAGDLYYRSMGHTAFDVPGDGIDGETNVLNLDTDAMRAVASELVPNPTPVALQAAGAVRGSIAKGKTGALSFADLYRVLPLGVDPTDGTPGYPLVRLHLLAAELRGALEQTLVFARSNNDFYLSPSGLAVTYDVTRPPFSPADPASGWITRLAIVDGAGETVLLDAAAGGWQVNPLTRLVPIVTTYQVAAFASSFGIAPRDATGQVIPIASTILRWPGTTASVKDHQAFARFVRAQCLANGGELPTIYDPTTAPGAVPRRILCAGAACP